jgi:hypothetical protein
MEINIKYTVNFVFVQVSRSAGPTKIELDAMEREKKTSFATLGRNSSGINITFSGGARNWCFVSTGSGE